MKKTVIIFILFSTASYAVTKIEEKLIELSTHPTKILLIKDNEYEIELYGHSAKYHANDTYLTCLKQSMSEKKNALLKITAYSLEVKKCMNE